LKKLAVCGESAAAEGGMDSQNTPSAGLLNEFQARRLRATCQYIDKLLSDISEILHASASKAAFPRFLPDIVPAQSRTIEDYLVRLRAQLVRVLDGQGIPRENPSIPASRAVHVALGTIDIAVEELKPHYMHGYGDLPEAAATELNGIVGELRGLVSKLDRYLLEGVGEDLKLRLDRLQQKSNDLELLSKLEEIVADRGLVEFRTTISSILDRAEDKTFEIAVFGRVSSGKSSLLNAILETDVLPVGVTPITAVPTRIIYGEKPSMKVSFAEAPSRTMEVTRLPEFATEQENPGNAKRVTRIVVTLPASGLQDGVSFVDTPGLGSLATSGAAETLAYLPKCDFGVVLIDAGSTLTTEDLQTLLTLQQATVPANVLLSKADLLGSEDREKIIEYVRQHIRSECNLELHVHPVSVLPSHKNLLSRWFEEQILPLYGHSQELRASSIQRKIGALRESVISALEMQLERSKKPTSDTGDRLRGTEARLRRATGLIEETRSAWEKEIEGLPNDLSVAFYAMSAGLIRLWSEKPDSAISAETIITDSVLRFAQQRVQKLQDSVKTLALQLRDDLRASATDLRVADMPSDDEFQSLIRGTPVFDMGSISASVSRTTIALMFGTQFAEKRLARRLYKQLREPIYQALNIYSGVLKEWVRLVTSHLDRRFETYAERYRAQAERSLGGTGLTADEANAIQANLRILDSPESDDFVEASPKQAPQNELNAIAREIVNHADTGESR
jgi:GTP-binding protein EngB required for normal cell division